MIEVFEGRLGGGKTYSAVVRIVDHLRQGGCVCTNVEIIPEAIKAYVARMWRVEVEDDQVIKLTDEEIGEFYKHTPSGTAELPVLVIVDEAHLNFNAREWNKTSPELLSFLTQSRKVHTDIIFISQSAENIDKQFRRLVQYIWRFRDMQRFKVAGLGIGWPFQQILVCQYDYDGKCLLDRRLTTKDVRIFKLYNTNSLLRTFPRLQGVNTKRDLKKITRKAPPMAKYVMILLLLGGCYAGYNLWAKYKDHTNPQAEVKPAATPAPISAHFQREAPANTATAQEKAKAAYEIYDETFRAWNGPDKTLQTETGWYTVGEMSGHGYVVAVSPERARVALPDGRPGWVVAEVKTAMVPKEKKSEVVPAVVAAVSAPQATPAPPLLARVPTVGVDQPDEAPAQTVPTGTSGGWPVNKLGNFPRRAR